MNDSIKKENGGGLHYLIDGHNLIPYLIPGGLENMDKEEKLLDVLQSFQAGAKSAIHVFFDKAPAGRAGVLRFGKITVHRVQSSLQADDAILQYLEKQGRRAGEFTVVSSDRRVQNGARRMRGAVMDSSKFKEFIHHVSGRADLQAKEKSALPPEDEKDIQEYFLNKI